MPRRELRYPQQVTDWLHEWGAKLQEPASMILIGSAGLLWHAARIGRDDPLPENSMDVDPVTDSDAVAELAYDALIGSEFEQTHGWHVNLMPPDVLREFPAGWEDRAPCQIYSHLTVTVPAATDLITAKMKRGEARDLAHKKYAEELGLV
ncbi:MAG: hypothetical protein ABL974_00935 [Prosthecobacter sp.]